MGSNPISMEDQIFMGITFAKMKDIVEENRGLIPLLAILSVFSPVNMELKDCELKLLQHYQQKASILIYTHFMSR